MINQARYLLAEQGEDYWGFFVVVVVQRVCWEIKDGTGAYEEEKITCRQKRENKGTRSCIPDTAPPKGSSENGILVHSSFQRFEKERERESKLTMQKLSPGGLTVAFFYTKMLHDSVM